MYAKWIGQTVCYGPTLITAPVSHWEYGEPFVTCGDGEKPAQHAGLSSWQYRGTFDTDELTLDDWMLLQSA